MGRLCKVCFEASGPRKKYESESKSYATLKSKGKLALFGPSFALSKICLQTLAH